MQALNKTHSKIKHFPMSITVSNKRKLQQLHMVMICEIFKHSNIVSQPVIAILIKVSKVYISNLEFYDAFNLIPKCLTEVQHFICNSTCK